MTSGRSLWILCSTVASGANSAHTFHTWTRSSRSRTDTVTPHTSSPSDTLSLNCSPIAASSNSLHTRVYEQCNTTNTKSRVNVYNTKIKVTELKTKKSQQTQKQWNTWWLASSCTAIYNRSVNGQLKNRPEYN